MNQDFVFENRPADISRTPLSVEGALPEGLRGTFLLIGPGRTELNGQRLHLLDGYGRIVAATLGPAGAELHGRHVQTKALADDLSAGTLTSRRGFTNKSARWSNLMSLDFGNNCMHNVCAFAGQVIAAQDPGYLLLDPQTLEVKRSLDFDGLHRRGANASPMPHIDPNTGRLVTWFAKPGLKDTVTVAELDTDLSVAKHVSCTIPPGGLMHDVGFTSRYYLMLRFAQISLAKLLWGAGPLFDAVQFGPKRAVLYLVPRAGGPAIAVPLPARTHFHFFNAFDDGDELVLDVIGYPGPVDFSVLSGGPQGAQPTAPTHPTPMPEVLRYRIHLDSLSVEERVMPQAACDAPTINPRMRGVAYRYGYAPMGSSASGLRDPNAFFWFSTLGKLDFQSNAVQTWRAPEGSVCSAASFVADPRRDAEDGGWVLSWAQDTNQRRSSLLIFDAQRFSDGPVARCHHPDLFGLVSHVDFLAAN